MLHAEPKIKIKGCPRSGTNFLEFLIYKNIHINPAYFDSHDIFGWKHGLMKPDDNYNYCIIFKNIYAWLKSLYDYVELNKVWKFQNFFPFDKSETLSDFLKNPFVHIHLKNTEINEENPIQYWNKMHENWYFTPIKGKKIFIHYENILVNAEEKINKIKTLLNYPIVSRQIIYPSGQIQFQGIHHKETSENISYHNYEYYKLQKYLEFFSSDDIKFVEDNYNYYLYKIMSTSSV